MKKLMIAFAAVSMAVVANASCYTWGLTSGDDKASNGTTYLTDTSFTVMLFTGSIVEKANGDGTYSLNFTGADWVDQTSTWNTGYTIGRTAFDKNRTSDYVTGADKQPYSILILDTGSDISDYENYEGTYAIVKGEGVLMQDKDTSTDYTRFTSGTAVTGSMYHTAAAVPEPTSGLLLLLGVAGLALRRRRV